MLNHLVFLISFLLPLYGFAANVEISGFGTTGIAVSDTDVIYAGNVSDEVNYLYRTRLGVNLSSQVAQSVTAQSQFVGSQVDSGLGTSPQVEIEWILANWQVASNVQVRLGKQRTPFFIASDFINVGLLYPWARPPLEVYQTNPLVSFSGLSLAYKSGFDNKEFNFELYGGGAEDKLPTPNPETFAEVSAKDSIGSRISYSFDESFIQASYIQGHADISLKTPVRDAFGAGSVVNTYQDLDLGFIQIWTFGFSVRLGQSFLQSEYSSVSTDLDTQNQDGWYAMYGYWFKPEKFSAFVYHAGLSNEEGTTGQDTSAIGLNYLPSQNVVAKLQFEVVEPKEENIATSGHFVADPGRAVNITTLTLDFVF